MNLRSLLTDAVKNYGNRPACTMRMGYRTIQLTFQDLYTMALQVGALLDSHGIKKGDRVVVIAPNSPYWAVLFWGCIMRGVVLVPLNIQSTRDIVERIINQTKPKLFFAYQFFKHDFTELKRYNVEFLDEHIRSMPAEPKLIEISDDDLVEILYTSGTTGAPKGVMLTHKNLYCNVHAVKDVINVSGNNERLLSILPLSHIFEQTIGMLVPTRVGAHVIYAHSHHAIRDLMKQYKITKILAVPEFLHVLLSKIKAGFEQKGKAELFKKMLGWSQKFGQQWLSRIIFYPVIKQLGGKLDAIASGGAPLDPELEKTWNAMGITIFQGYGLTETSPVIACNSIEKRKPGSVGQVVQGVKLKVADDGQILVKGDSVFQGYYNNEEKTTQAFEDGWFKTGDIGELDVDSFLFLKGRKKYMILGAGGQNVFPEDLEQVLNSQEGVKDSCVLGMPLDGGRVQIHACLLLSGQPLDAQKIVDHANQQLASYQQIGACSVWPDDDFERTPTRKIKKEAVRKWLLEQHEQNTAAISVHQSPLKKILAQLTGMQVGSITENSKLITDLQMDSLLRIELVMRIEQEMGSYVDEALITPETTVADFEEFVEQKVSAPKGPTLSTWPQSWWARGLRFAGQSVLFPLSATFAKIKVSGLEHVQNCSGPFILMPNHLSYFDAFAVVRALPGRLRRKLVFAAAQDVLFEEFKQFALLGQLLFNAFPFPRKEHENVNVGLEFMGRLLDENFSVVLFPEGTISNDGALLPLKKGAGLVATQMCVPVIPVKLVGTNDIFPYDKMLPHKRGTIEVRFAEPMKFERSESYVEATRKIQQVLHNL